MRFKSYGHMVSVPVSYEVELRQDGETVQADGGMMPSGLVLNSVMSGNYPAGE